MAPFFHILRCSTHSLYNDLLSPFWELVFSSEPQLRSHFPLRCPCWLPWCHCCAQETSLLSSKAVYPFSCSVPSLFLTATSDLTFSHLNLFSPHFLLLSVNGSTACRICKPQQWGSFLSVSHDAVNHQITLIDPHSWVCVNAFTRRPETTTPLRKPGVGLSEGSVPQLVLVGRADAGDLSRRRCWPLLSTDTWSSLGDEPWKCTFLLL